MNALPFELESGEMIGWRLWGEEFNAWDFRELLRIMLAPVHVLRVTLRI